MPPNKRRIAPGGIHQGPLTRPAAMPDRANREPDGMGALDRRRTPEQLEPTSRYTPKRKSVRLRPTWHKVTGYVMLAVAVVTFLLNQIMLLSPSVALLPGGHNAGYMFLGFALAAWSTWWLGWFDRER